MSSHSKSATLYRMVIGPHTCPYGLKSRALLRRRGYAVDDRLLTSRPDVDVFKAEHDVKTTPQTFIDGKRIGGYDDLRRHFGIHVRDANETSYRPVLVVFAVAALIAVALSVATMGTLSVHTVEWFVGIGMCILALLKLQDVETFSSMFLGYDLLARRVVGYAYVYPYAELAAGLLMLLGIAKWPAVALSAVLGGIGAVSVFKAVYLEKRELKCACVGGGNKVPLGFVSLTENLAMLAMAAWMAATH